jgi:uncharacterized protein
MLVSSTFLGLSAITSPRSLSCETTQSRGIVDFHTHLTLGWYKQEGDPITAYHLLRWMDAHGIDKAVILPLVSPEAFWYPVTTDYVLSETAQHRDRLIPFCAIDPRTLGTHLPTQQEVKDLLRRYLDAGARGFGEHKPFLAIDDPLNMRIFQAASEVGLPVLIHLDNQANVDKPGLPGVQRVLTEFPELVLIGHGKGWWASIAGNLVQADLHVGYPAGPVAPGGALDRLLTAHPNLYGDLSSSGAHALLRDKAMGKAFLTRHSQRLLFGTDYYSTKQLEFPQFTMFDELEIDAPTRRLVERENALRLLRLG